MRAASPAAKPSHDLVAEAMAELLKLRKVDGDIRHAAAADRFDPWTLCAQRNAASDEKRRVYDDLVEQWDERAAKSLRALFRLMDAGAALTRSNDPEGYERLKTTAIGAAGLGVVGLGVVGTTAASLLGPWGVLTLLTLYTPMPELAVGGARSVLASLRLVQGSGAFFARCNVETMVWTMSRRPDLSMVHSMVAPSRPIGKLLARFVDFGLNAVGANIPALAPWLLMMLSYLNVPLAQDLLKKSKEVGKDQGACDISTYLIRLLSQDGPARMRKSDLPATEAFIATAKTRPSQPETTSSAHWLRSAVLRLRAPARRT